MRVEKCLQLVTPVAASPRRPVNLLARALVMLVGALPANLPALVTLVGASARNKALQNIVNNDIL